MRFLAQVNLRALPGQTACLPRYAVGRMRPGLLQATVFGEQQPCYVGGDELRLPTGSRSPSAALYLGQAFHFPPLLASWHVGENEELH